MEMTDPDRQLAEEFSKKSWCDIDGNGIVKPEIVDAYLAGLINLYSTRTFIQSLVSM
jgi:hypothetical protein